MSLWMEKPELLPEVDRLAVTLGKKLMRTPYRITDQQLEQLVAVAGEERTVAIVALLAHAAFQDRIILFLGTGPEDPPCAPVQVRFGRSWPQPSFINPSVQRTKEAKPLAAAKPRSPRPLLLLPNDGWSSKMDWPAKGNAAHESASPPERKWWPELVQTILASG
jgi:hypothetical protein